ncbi:MAG: hypothetical protein JWO49_1913 [Arthrobacter sp.]|nr:hypothetical protein [Arthrobacter sp.]
MLRVRPIHFSSRLDHWERLLTDLGLVKTAGGTDSREFDAGSGRLALRRAADGSAADGTTAFGVEVRDPAEFARRTNQAGTGSGNTPAELIQAEHGESCRITGGDGFTFLADKAARAAGSADADPALAVVEVWFTEDGAAAAETLQSMGARFRPVPDDDETADFTAKNGGVLMVRPALGPPRSGLGFEYDGDLDALRDRLTAAGHEVSMTEEAYGRSLHVANPDAAGRAAKTTPTIWVAARHPS